MREPLLLDGGRELLAGAEAGDPARLDLNRLARLGIPAHPRLPLRDGERAEADERHSLTLLKRLGDSIHQRIQSLACGGLAYPNILRNLLDEIGLVHCIASG